MRYRGNRTAIKAASPVLDGDNGRLVGAFGRDILPRILDYMAGHDRRGYSSGGDDSHECYGQAPTGAALGF